ncbi:MAG: hypothetical protein IPG87_19425 [Saprospiraceae bacterium]|nr:hypothetical protein [Candidatus Vicinibacter affinis]
MLFGEPEIAVVNHPKFLWSDELIGQLGLMAHVKEVLAQDRFPHCSLISGTPGSGQLVFALSIIQTMLCEAEEKPCGVCSGCYKVGGLIHPDVHYSFPLVGSGELCKEHYGEFRNAVKQNPYMSIQNWLSYADKENKQANIGAKESRSIIERLSLRPFESDRNIMLLWLPEYLGKESNILLKLLEEPPGHSYIILVTEDSKSLLSTVISRTQEFRLGPLDDFIIAGQLEKSLKLSPDLALGFAMASEGNYAQSIEWAKDPQMNSLQLSQSLLQLAFKKEPVEMMNWIDTFAQLNRDGQRQFLAFLNQLLSLSLRLKFGIISQNDLANPILSYAAKISSNLTPGQVEAIAYLSDECSYGIQRNANIRILLLDFLIKLSGILRNKQT